MLLFQHVLGTGDELEDKVCHSIVTLSTLKQIRFRSCFVANFTLFLVINNHEYFMNHWAKCAPGSIAPIWFKQSLHFYHILSESSKFHWRAWSSLAQVVFPLVKTQAKVCAKMLYFLQEKKTGNTVCYQVGWIYSRNLFCFNIQWLLGENILFLKKSLSLFIYQLWK